MIETASGRSRIHGSAVQNSERQCVEVHSLVESKLPHRAGVIGIVLFIENEDAMVRWPYEGRPNGACTVEKVNNLRVGHVKPM